VPDSGASDFGVVKANRSTGNPAISAPPRNPIMLDGDFGPRTGRRFASGVCQFREPPPSNGRGARP
jgi:hypothetical protein